MNREEDKIIMHCSECDISSTDAVLFSILLPPTITEKTYLCRTCLNVAIDNSKKSNKGKESKVSKQ